MLRCARRAMKDLYVEVNGSGPDLVLLHEWGLNVRVWDSPVGSCVTFPHDCGRRCLVMGGALGARPGNACEQRG